MDSARGRSDSPPRDDRVVTVWRLRAWDDEQLQEAWLQDAVVSISEDVTGDMSRRPSRAVIKRRLELAHPDKGEHTIGIWAGYWCAFLQMAPGDLVVVPLAGQEVAVAEVVGDYEYVPDDPNPRLRHRKAVRWLTRMPRRLLPDDIRKTVNSPGTICRVRAPDADRWLRALDRPPANGSARRRSEST